MRSESRLRLPLRRRHFKRGRVGAKCVASMLTMHWQSADAVAVEERPATLAKAAEEDEENDVVGRKQEEEEASSKVAGVKNQLTNAGKHTCDNNILTMLC